MEKFVAGDIVVIPFPYTDLSQFKRRPALILKDLGNDDFLLAMITSKAYNSPYSLQITESDFTTGGLPAESYVRCNRLFEVNSSIILEKSSDCFTTVYRTSYRPPDLVPEIGATLKNPSALLNPANPRLFCATL